MSIYDCRGMLRDMYSDYANNADFSYAFNSTAETNYTVIRVFQTKLDGTKQFPFVRKPATKKTAYELADIEGWSVVINAGINDGMLIENSIVITDAAASRQTGVIPLTINNVGTLGYVGADTTGKGQTYVDSGIVSAVCGFFPIIDNYENYSYPTDIPGTFDTASWVQCQRNVIGQFDNGDYCIITGEGRGYANSVGFTIPQLQDLCKSLGLKFAYDLDGGGSTETVIGKKMVNTIYETSEHSTGRPINALIAFNGLSTFKIPNFS